MVRNPYVILGIPFGASKDDASAAFARKARGLRRANDPGGRLPDLTWALNQVQEVVKDPRIALDIYRVPADPEAFRTVGPGALGPKPELLRQRAADHGAALDQLMSEAKEEAIAAIRQEVASAASLPPR